MMTNHRVQPQPASHSSSNHETTLQKAQEDYSSVTSSNAIWDQLELLKSLMRDHLDDCREQSLRSEELERESEQIRLEKEVRGEEMKNLFHGALEAQKSLSSIHHESIQSEVAIAEDLETIREAIQETHLAQMAELRRELEENVRYKRQRQEELQETLRIRHRS